MGQQISAEQLLMTIGKLHVTIEALEARLAELEAGKAKESKKEK